MGPIRPSFRAGRRRVFLDSSKQNSALPAHTIRCLLKQMVHIMVNGPELSLSGQRPRFSLEGPTAAVAFSSLRYMEI